MLDRSLGSPFARAAVVAAMALVPVPTAGQGLAEPVASATAQTVTFTDHIRPIMERSCWNCHGEAAQLSNLDLRTRDGALAGGTRGPAIVPGRADESRLYRQLAGLEQPAMPMDGSTLTDAEIAAVRTWIDDGAHWDTGGATSAADALSVLEDAELPPGARDYWAFKLPVQAPVPAFPELVNPIDRFLETARRDRARDDARIATSELPKQRCLAGPGGAEELTDDSARLRRGTLLHGLQRPRPVVLDSTTSAPSTPRPAAATAPMTRLSALRGRTGEVGAIPAWSTAMFAIFWRSISSETRASSSCTE